MEIIRLDNVSVGIWPKKIIDSVPFIIDEGEKVAIYGGDDNVKKIILLIMSAIFRPTLGKVEINGNNVLLKRSEVRKNMGIGEFEGINDFDDNSTVKENLVFVARALKMKEVNQSIINVLSLLELEDILNKKYYSLDYLDKSLVSLAAALINNPRILIITEPTKNLTLIEREKFWESFNKVIDGRTSVFSTRDVLEAEKYADRVFEFKGNRLNQVIKE